MAVQVFENAPAGNLTDDYFKANLPILDQQLGRAGLRLAKMLNDPVVCSNIWVFDYNRRCVRQIRTKISDHRNIQSVLLRETGASSPTTRAGFRGPCRLHLPIVLELD